MGSLRELFVKIIQAFKCSVGKLIRKAIGQTVASLEKLFVRSKQAVESSIAQLFGKTIHGVDSALRSLSQCFDKGFIAWKPRDDLFAAVVVETLG
jgi:hypothetical protein